MAGPGNDILDGGKATDDRDGDSGLDTSRNCEHNDNIP